MEEIKVGEYVRTREGIRKIIGIIKTQYTYPSKNELVRTKATFVRYEVDKLYKNELSISKEEMKYLKHSPRLIDLIQKGDFVNGCYVYRSLEEQKEYFKGHLKEGEEINFIQCSGDNDITNNDIKTILTKEQYTANCYEVK